MKKFKEWLNIQVVKNPGTSVIVFILLFNLIFFLISTLLIKNLSPASTEKMGMLEAVFCTITMILDAGCIQFVIKDFGAAGVAVVILCLGIVIVGMITFTGAVIGYLTNYISHFIENANAGNSKLRISDHNVILNWNTRASEIINDLLYCPVKQTMVVLVPPTSDRVAIEKEIKERISDTVNKENAIIIEQSAGMGFFKRKLYRFRYGFRKNINVIVRQGDVFSSKQLRDISLEKAKMIIILGNDVNNSVCKYEYRQNFDTIQKGNPLTVKTLMQVADITAAAYSADDQKIIVEITDEWTSELVDRIISYKQVEGKCNIVPVRVNQILGSILSQFSLMPELNLAYRELFSNKGATFYSEVMKPSNERDYIVDYLKSHKHSIPLTYMESKGVGHFYFSTGNEKDIHRISEVQKSDYTVSLNKDYWIERKNIIILGHNTRCIDIMNCLAAFECEWGYKDKDQKIVRVVVIDDEKHLEKMNYYKEFGFVVKTVAADIYDKDRICDAITSFVDSNKEDTSILILSDDSAPSNSIDANALANLVYVQDIIKNKENSVNGFDVESIDVVVEIIDPKHHDVVSNYSVNNVVISNRYISKMITQIGEKESLFDFYTDILTYDTDEAETNENIYESKEVYVKKVSRFFDEVPKKTTADKFIRAVFEASIDNSLPLEKQNPCIVLGYVKRGGEIVLFNGNQSKITVDLSINDKLIVFSNH